MARGSSPLHELHTPAPFQSDHRGTGQEQNQEFHYNNQHKRKPKAMAALKFRQHVTSKQIQAYGITHKFQSQKKCKGSTSFSMLHWQAYDKIRKTKSYISFWRLKEPNR